MSKRMLALVGAASVVVGLGVASAPAVMASATATHAAKPTSVSLSSSFASVKSSTKQSLHVELEASNNPSTPANDTVMVELSKGALAGGEAHAWTFPISSSVLDVAASGAGSLKVPSRLISPFGSISLKIKPIGKIASKSCQGQVISKSERVALSGVFFFDSKSTGAHKWGTVGSKKSFTFPATNTVTWLFSSSTSENCISTSAPCSQNLFWSAEAGGVSFDGFQTSTGSTLRAGRAVNLSKPKGAMRNDSNVGLTTPPTVSNNGTQGNPTLTVSGDGAGVSGTATIAGSAPASTFNAPCGKGQTEITQLWSGSYSNGSPPLTVAEEIYGALTLPNGAEGTVSQTSGG
jgi:hypothetical protein